MAKRYVDKHHHHRHLCLSCQTVWEHSDNCRTECSAEEFEKMHECPKCGRRQGWKYDGPLGPGEHKPKEGDDVLGPGHERQLSQSGVCKDD